jgi:hypothetical protein
MVINDLDVFGTCPCPAEADAPLVVDPDAVLALPIAAKHLESVSGRHTQVVEAGGNLELAQLAASHCRDILESSHPLAARQAGGVGTPECPDHAG